MAKWKMTGKRILFPIPRSSLISNRYTLNFMKPQGRKTSRPHRVQAEEVAILLVKHGVRIAVVNACKSAVISGAGECTANLADTFIRSGLDATIAMSFNAMDSTMELFTGFFYLYLLVYGKSLLASVAEGRKRLFKNDSRKATLGQRVSIMDYFVPTLYCSSEFDSFGFAITPMGAKSDSFADSLAYMTGLIEFLEPLELAGRDQEICEMEILLDLSPISLLYGQGGIGKSALARHLSWWWKTSGLVDHVIHLDLDIPEYQNFGLVRQFVTDSIKAHEVFKMVNHLDGSSSEDAIISLFKTNSCLLIIDSLEIMDKQLSIEGADAENKQMRLFLEKLTESNEGSFDPGNSYVLLISRHDHVFGWNSTGDIAGFQLEGLPLFHGMQYGWDVVCRHSKTPNEHFPTNDENKNYLERIIEIISGNPLAIEIIFPELCRPGSSPRAVFEAVLTGCVVPNGDDPYGESVLDAWKRPRKGICSRFFADVANVLETVVEELLREEEDTGMIPFFLGTWNCVFPRALDAQALFLKKRLATGERKAPVPYFDAMMSKFESIDQVKMSQSNLIDEIFGKLEDNGLITPIMADKILSKSSGPEYYRLHPVLTIWLRSLVKDFVHAMGDPGQEFLMTVVDYRVWWDVMHAKHSIAMFPKHEHDAQKIRAFEGNGRWNLVSSVMRASRYYDKIPISENEMSLVARLMIPMSSLLESYQEVVVILQQYLEVELSRHLKSSLVDEKEAVLYPATKLAYCLRYGSTPYSWSLIDKTLAAAERFRERGLEYSGYTEISIMETKTTQAICMLEYDTARAIDLFERNLRYEPCSDDSAMPSIRRDIFQNLQHWASAKSYHETKKDEVDRSSKGKEKKADMFSGGGKVEWDMDEGTIEKWWAGSVKDSFLLQNANLATTESFSNFTKSLLNGSQRDVIGDLAPDNAKLVSYMRDSLAHFLESTDFVALMASLRLIDGDTELAKLEFRRGLEKQLQSENDAPTTVWLHNELYKLAIKEEKWRTAAQHGENIIKVGPGGGLFETWLNVAGCYEKADDPGKFRSAALEAIKTAASHPLGSSESRDEQIVSCIRRLLGFRGITDFSYIYPKRSLEDPDNDDTLNLMSLIRTQIEICYKSGNEHFYERDGWMFMQLYNAMTEYTALFLKNDGSGEFYLPPGTARGLTEVIVDLNQFGAENSAAIRAGELDVLCREAELCLFSHEKPKLTALKTSKWAQGILERRFS
jgi:hypothetical protein